MDYESNSETITHWRKLIPPSSVTFSCGTHRGGRYLDGLHAELRDGSHPSISSTLGERWKLQVLPHTEGCHFFAYTSLLTKGKNHFISF